jgi:hypothetical protein
MELGLKVNAVLNTSAQKIPSTSSSIQSFNNQNVQNSNQNENTCSNGNNNNQFVHSFNSLNLNSQNNPYKVNQSTMYNQKRLNRNEDRGSSSNFYDKTNSVDINSSADSRDLPSSSTSINPSHTACSSSRYNIPDDIQDLIYSDTQNGVIWENIIEAEDEIQFSKMVLSSFKCPMCFELVNNPLTIKCGHNICLSCIKARYYDIDNKCPTCKSTIFAELENISEQKKIELTKGVINNYPVNTTLNTILSRIFPSRDLNGSIWS